MLTLSGISSLSIWLIIVCLNREGFTFFSKLKFRVTFSTSLRMVVGVMGSCPIFPFRSLRKTRALAVS